MEYEPPSLASCWQSDEDGGDGGVEESSALRTMLSSAMPELFAVSTPSRITFERIPSAQQRTYHVVVVVYDSSEGSLCVL
jgi:hypothetical protein